MSAVEGMARSAVATLLFRSFRTRCFSAWTTLGFMAVDEGALRIAPAVIAVDLEDELVVLCGLRDDDTELVARVRGIGRALLFWVAPAGFGRIEVVVAARVFEDEEEIEERESFFRESCCRGGG